MHVLWFQYKGLLNVNWAYQVWCKLPRHFKEQEIPNIKHNFKISKLYHTYIIKYKNENVMSILRLVMLNPLKHFE